MLLGARSGYMYAPYAQCPTYKMDRAAHASRPVYGLATDGDPESVAALQRAVAAVVRGVSGARGAGYGGC